jgi:hypothetical protein
MEMTSTKAELVHIRDFPESVTATIPRADFEAALGFEEPAELFLEVRGLEGDAKGESRDVSVTWSKEELEQLLAETTGPAITLAFDQNELQSILLEPEVDAHGFREKALILTVAAAAAAGSGASVAAAAHNEAGPATGITPSYVAVHDEAGLTARGIAATPLVASHDEAGLAARGIETSVANDEATLAARGIDAGTLAASHDEATLAARGIEGGTLAASHDEATLAARGIDATTAASHDEATLAARGIDAGTLAASHDEATLASRGIDAGSLPATPDEATLAARGIAPGHLAASHDEATLTARGITPVAATDDGGIAIDAPTIDASTAAAVGAGIAGLGLLITAAGFAARRQKTAHPA